MSYEMLSLAVDKLSATNAELAELVVQVQETTNDALITSQNAVSRANELIEASEIAKSTAETAAYNTGQHMQAAADSAALAKSSSEIAVAARDELTTSAADASASANIAVAKANEASASAMASSVSENASKGYSDAAKLSENASIAAKTAAETAKAQAEAARDSANAASAAAAAEASAAANSATAAESARDETALIKNETLAIKDAAANAAAESSSSAEDAAAAAAAAADRVSDIQAIETEIRNQYYGPLAASPSARPDGTPIQPGDEYFDSTIGRKQVYNGSTWSDVAGAVVSDMQSKTDPLKGAGMIGFDDTLEYQENTVGAAVALANEKSKEAIDRASAAALMLNPLESMGFRWHVDSSSASGAALNDWSKLGTAEFVGLASGPGATFADNSIYHSFSSDPSPYSACGLRSSEAVVKRGLNPNVGGFVFEAIASVVGYIDGTNAIIGLSSNSTQAYGNFSGTDIGVGIGWNTSDTADSEISLFVGSGSAVIKTPIPGTRVGDETPYYVRVACMPAGDDIEVTLVNMETGVTVLGKHKLTAELPDGGTALFPVAQAGTGETAAALSVRVWRLSAVPYPILVGN